MTQHRKFGAAVWHDHDVAGSGIVAELRGSVKARRFQQITQIDCNFDRRETVIRNDEDVGLVADAGFLKRTQYRAEIAIRIHDCLERNWRTGRMRMLRKIGIA